MDGSGNIGFNDQLMGGVREQVGSVVGLNISPAKRILTLIKEANLNGLKNFLDSLSNPGGFLNQVDKDLHQSPVYHSVQIKNPTLAFGITSLLMSFGVWLFWTGYTPLIAWSIWFRVCLRDMSWGYRESRALGFVS